MLPKIQQRYPFLLLPLPPSHTHTLTHTLPHMQSSPYPPSPLPTALRAKDKTPMKPTNSSSKLSSTPAPTRVARYAWSLMTSLSCIAGGMCWHGHCIISLSYCTSQVTLTPAAATLVPESAKIFNKVYLRSLASLCGLWCRHFVCVNPLTSTNLVWVCPTFLAHLLGTALDRATS